MVPESRHLKVTSQVYRLLPKIQWEDTKSRHLSVVVDTKGRVLAWGINQKYKTHPIASKFNYRFNNLHSELSVIVKATRLKLDLETLIGYNFRFMKDGSLGFSMPCLNCQKLILSFGFRAWFFFSKNEWIDFYDCF